MKITKKLLTLIIAGLLCLSLAACSGGDDEKKDKKPAKGSELHTEESVGDEEKEPDVIVDETDEDEEKDPEETEDKEDEPVDYDFSAYAGTWVYNNEFLTVDEEGNWDYTTGGAENFNGTLKYENGNIVTYVEGINKPLSVTLTPEGKLIIEDFATFSPNTETGDIKATDMSVFAGEWYLDGDINSRFYYRVNADGSWTQYEKEGESSTQVDSGRTVANDEENMFILITQYGESIIAEYDSAEDTMYINGDAYVHLS